MKNKAKKQSASLEKVILIAVTAILVGVILSAWGTITVLRNTIAEKNEVINKNVHALIEIERIRNFIEAKVSNGRSFFLLGSKVLFDEQKKNQQEFKDALTSYEKQYNLPQVPEIIQQIVALEQQHQDIFDQAMKFREQQTESKIVGQFFQAKSVPIRTSINDALTRLVSIKNEDLERARAAAHKAEAQIAQGILWFTGVIVLLVISLMLLVIRMLFERNRQHAERNRLFEEAKKANQGRDEVMAAIAYDLKNPLSEISKSLEILETSKEQNVTDSVEAIKRSVTVTESLIKDIVDQAKSDLGNMTLRLDQIEINDILAEARLALEPWAKQHDVRLHIDMANPPVLAFFDRERVMRVLSNLVGNAIKFSPKQSKIGIRVRSDQQFVHISVTDSGSGIPEKQLPHIFDQFWQARKTADQGAGLGLAIVKTIIEAHGGMVRVDSKVGSGSTFTFTLPRRRPVGAVLGKPMPTIKDTGRAQPKDVF